MAPVPGQGTSQGERRPCPNCWKRTSLPPIFPFSLEVTDSEGLGSCEKALYDVKVGGVDSILFVLAWHPVAAGQQISPLSGSDADLHLIHPDAVGDDVDGDGKPDGYYDLQFDCFWFNPNPNWDSPMPAEWLDDDAHMVVDSTTGETPELITLGGQCPSSHDYEFGVHYFKDNGYGPIQATVTVFYEDSVLFQESRQLQPLDLWRTGIFHCGEKSVSELGQVIHDYVNSSFVLPD